MTDSNKLIEKVAGAIAESGGWEPPEMWRNEARAAIAAVYDDLTANKTLAMLNAGREATEADMGVMDTFQVMLDAKRKELGL